MPPVLDPKNSKVDGLAFLGLSLARKSDVGHPDSITHQSAFDLNEVLDREYEFLFSTNDDGWLVGGGEPGPPKSYKLAAKDSAHVEIMRIGTFRKEWGGVPKEEILRVLKSGAILIPQIEVVPTAVVANPDHPPELEIRFDMEPQVPDFGNDEAPLPINWQLRFLHNQLFKLFIFPSRFCPGAFHSTILRKAEFRSDHHRLQYFATCNKAIQRWREMGPQALNVDRNGPDGLPLKKLAATKGTFDDKKAGEEGAAAGDQKGDDNGDEVDEIEQIRRQNTGMDANTVGYINAGNAVNPETQFIPSMEDAASASEGLKVGLNDTPVFGKEHDEKYSSGIWLFTDRENITNLFEPNFLPPYDTPEKRKIIMDVLSEEWDETTLSWKPCGEGSMTKRENVPDGSLSRSGAAVANSSSSTSPLDNVIDGFNTAVQSLCSPTKQT